MRKNSILAVQLPAICPLRCTFCRTPEHNQGDSRKVIDAINNFAPNSDEIYLTSNGETGLFVGFNKLVDTLIKQGKKVSVLCATPRSIIAGLSRVEISMNEFTKELAELAITKAQSLNVPIVISMVYNGEDQDLEKIGKKYGVDAVLMRALQKEGNSSISGGTTKFVRITSTFLGSCPVPAYKELKEFNENKVICINHQGEIVTYLGDPNNL